MEIGILIYGVRQTEFFVIWGHFFPFYSTDDPENQDFKKMKKTSGDVIILYPRIINDNHMTHGCWDVERNEQNFFSFWIIFCRFASITTQKIRFSKKQKKTTGDIIILHLCTINDNHMMNGSWDMERDGQIFFFILGHFLPFYPTNNPQNQNFEKMKKLFGDIIILHKFAKKHDHMLYCLWHTNTVRCVTDVIFIFHFGLFLALLHPWWPKK